MGITLVRFFFACNSFTLIIVSNYDNGESVKIIKKRMKPMHIFHMLFVLLLSVFNQVHASILVPASLSLGSVNNLLIGLQLLILFSLELYFLRKILKQALWKIAGVTVIMNSASAVLISWGPFLIIRNLITSRIALFLAYSDIKDAPLLSSISYGLVAAAIWIILNIAIEMVIVLIFFHDANKRKLFKLLLAVHIIAILLGVAIAGAQVGYN